MPGEQDRHRHDWQHDHQHKQSREYYEMGLLAGDIAGRMQHDRLAPAQSQQQRASQP
jgi:hypothetical protein